MPEQTTPDYYTVVYEVAKGHHDEWWQTIQPLFLQRKKPINVVVVSVGDKIEELDALMEKNDA